MDITAVDGKTVLYEKTAEQLQNSIAVKNDVISGAIEYVTGYESYPEDKQEGYYLALSVVPHDGVIVTTELVNGTDDDVLTKGTDHVYRIKDQESQKVRITVTVPEWANYTDFKDYSIGTTHYSEPISGSDASIIVDSENWSLVDHNSKK